MSTKKAIQLTNRDSQAKWKVVKQGQKPEFINMADMSDVDLQKALEVNQIRKIRAFLEFKNESQREAQLKQAAKDRNLTLLDLGYSIPKNLFIESRFVQYKDIMITAYNSILRKAKEIAKELKKEEE